jgi:hypothetical protein
MPFFALRFPLHRKGEWHVKFDVFSCGVDETLPLIYLWQIESQSGEVTYRYVGKASGGSGRPRKHYQRNVLNLLAGKPYRKSKPEKYREVHIRLAEATKLGSNLSLYLLENVIDVSAINRVEKAAQIQYCTRPYSVLPMA